jgi:hypothetical protein
MVAVTAKIVEIVETAATVVTAETVDIEENLWPFRNNRV